MTVSQKRPAASPRQCGTCIAWQAAAGGGRDGAARAAGMVRLAARTRLKSWIQDRMGVCLCADMIILPLQQWDCTLEISWRLMWIRVSAITSALTGEPVG